MILIIGILAAIAIPSFLSQKDKAGDASAKSYARNMQTAEETYFTDNARTRPRSRSADDRAGAERYAELDGSDDLGDRRDERLQSHRHVEGRRRVQRSRELPTGRPRVPATEETSAAVTPPAPGSTASLAASTPKRQNGAGQRPAPSAFEAVKPLRLPGDTDRVHGTGRSSWRKGPFTRFTGRPWLESVPNPTHP